MHPDAGLTTVELDLQAPIWNRFFTIAPLVIVGTRELDGTADFAPKHMATPLGWENYFGFVCTPLHSTYRNIEREQEFTVSYPHPDQVILTSLSAAPRCEDDVKVELAAMPKYRASLVNADCLKGAYLCLECKLDRIIDGFEKNSLICGRIVAARVRTEALRSNDRDDQDVLAASPLMAYVSPGRYASIDETRSFPFPTGFRRGDE